jgi:YidC/Oxa1 family membrane protein insertase
MGWENTIPFLILPVFLVISQFVSMQLMQPKSDDPQQQQANIILKALPIMIGWFALNVPSALCIYWVVNNIVTTATTLLIRNAMQTDMVVSASGAVSSTPPPPSSPFAPPPMRDRPAGFGSTLIDDGEVKPLTPVKPLTAASVKPLEVVDAEVETEAVSEIENEAVKEPGTGIGSTSSSTQVRE